MNRGVARLDQVLLVVGAAATLVCLLLSVLLALDGIAQGHDADLLTGVAFVATGAFAVLKRPGHRAARGVLAVGTLLTVYIALGRILSLAGPVSWFWAANALNQALEVATLSACVYLFAVFPDGAYQRSYERRIVRACSALVPIVPVLLLLTRPLLYVNTNTIFVDWSVASPLYIPALAIFDPLAFALYDGDVLLVLLAVGLLTQRYRRFGREQQRQIAWPLLSALLFGFSLMLAVLSDYGQVPTVVGLVLFNSTIILLPIAFGIGLLRHRLFDIEVVIRKSLIYGALWLMITLGYGALAAALGIAAGERLPVAVTIVGTITATLLFQPPRHRLERLANRWVFGERLDGYELLTRFGATLEGTVDPEELVRRIAATVRQGLGVRWVRVSILPGFGVASSTARGVADECGLYDPVDPAASAMLIHSGEQIGTLECGPKEEGLFVAKDHELLATLSRQAAIAIRKVQLAGELTARLQEIELQACELAASRTRIVQAGEAERRRIERNIHDGAQQQLVALLTKIRLARNQLSRNPQLAETALAELQGEARQALEDLRELTRGIHPAVLSDHGLLEAIEARVTRLPIGVTVEANGMGRETRYSEELEGAAYFFVCEALANVLKHARTPAATVRLSTAAGDLAVEVVDEGCGFEPDRVASSGLRGLSDRIEALGGMLQVVSQPEGGTTLTARLPIQERARD